MIRISLIPSIHDFEVVFGNQDEKKTIKIFRIVDQEFGEFVQIFGNIIKLAKNTPFILFAKFANSNEILPTTQASWAANYETGTPMSRKL